MTNLRMGWIVLLFSIVVGCTHFGEYLSIPDDKGMSHAYLRTLNQWTRKESIYSQFETRATIITTYKSNTFMKGYLDEYARIYNLTDVEKMRREEIQQGFSKQSVEFLLYAAMPDKDANDFGKANSIWKIFLLDEKGERHEPIEIRKVEKIDPTMETFFPFVNKYYGICYTLKFSPVMTGDGTNITGQKPIKVFYTSVIGSIQQAWP